VPKTKTLVPQQARSRESLNRLMRAAIEVLGQHGVDGATIPRIAGHAGLTPGAVYRRFRNKDVLLETAILRILEDQNSVLRLSFPIEGTVDLPFERLAEQLINSLVLSYRVNARLICAIRQLLQMAEGTSFWKKASKLEMQSFEYLVDVLTQRDEIKHADPRAAAALALVMVMGTLWEILVVPGDAKLWKALMPKDDRSLKRELVRSFLSYLGVAQKEGK
jgi:AcrR family transcriptional regulator